jgi:hypothetical protein
MDANPPFSGINWVSCIELALRLISVATAFSIVGLAHLTAEQRAGLSRFFHAHEYWIARYPSLYSSANNHYMAELTGLITSAKFAQGDSRSMELGLKSIDRLIEQLELQILPDGVGAEQAPNYTAFAVELALFGLRVARRSADQITEVARQRLGAYADHIRWLMDENGGLPDIGDWDNSRVIAMEQEPEAGYAASIVSAVSGYLNRPDLAPAMHVPHIRDIVFSSTTSGLPCGSGMRTWKEGGYSVIRRESPLPFVFVLDHGPLGYLSIAAHGHADALAIWLSVRGQPIIIDAGTYLYHSDPAWRERFRGTPLHNTLCISKKPSSRPGGPFNWVVKAKARLVEAELDPVPRIVAEHDGFVARYGVRHRRSVTLSTVQSITITDELVGHRMNRDVSIGFLIDPSCAAVANAINGAVEITRCGKGVLRLSGNGVLRPRIVRGSDSEGLGWASLAFGSKIPADQIVFEGRLDAPSEITIRILVHAASA